uniref:Pathogenesis-related protein 1 n=1 Tax=Zanthoxylum armatum TaxID=67938 RepID=A0A9E9FWP5_9ROSI|nr:PR-1 [Zanthoxylum armatum]
MAFSKMMSSLSYFSLEGFLAVALALALILAHLPSSNAQDSPQGYVDAHNAARALVGVGPVTWDETIANFSRTYASTRVADCRLVHSGDRRYGENLAGSTGNLSGRDAVNLWVSEKVFYDYNSNTCAAGQVCGHYTQVVWRNSVRIGCGKVRCKNGGTFIGCNYAPPGNYNGRRPY